MSIGSVMFSIAVNVGTRLNRHPRVNDDHAERHRTLGEHQTGQQHDQSHAQHRRRGHPSTLPTLVVGATGREPRAVPVQRPLDLLEPALFVIGQCHGSPLALAEKTPRPAPILVGRPPSTPAADHRGPGPRPVGGQAPIGDPVDTTVQAGRGTPTGRAASPTRRSRDNRAESGAKDLPQTTTLYLR